MATVAFAQLDSQPDGMVREAEVAHSTWSFVGRNILVTGGAGFIGSHLVEALVADGARVTVVDNFKTGRRENLTGVASQLSLLECDLHELLRDNLLVLGEFDTLFHLAANAYIPPSIENPAFDFQTNAHTTFLLLERLRQIPKRPRLVNVSTAAVYGNPTTLPIREDAPLAPISPYGVSKLAGERYAAVYAQLFAIHATSLRLFSVYGPRQRKQVVYDILHKLRANPNDLTVLGDGTQRRDFCFVDDVVQALLLAAQRAPGQGEVYNVASGTSHSIRELIEVWSMVLQMQPRLAFTGNVRPGDAERWEVDITALRGLGYQPKTTLRDGLTAIRDWYDRTSR